MTKLEAVNEILMKTGGLPVRALDTDGASKAAMAERVLDAEDLRIQMEGWHCNTEIMELTADSVTNRIDVPTGTLEIDTAEEDEGVNVTQRGGHLYDIENGTLDWDAGKTLKCEVVRRIEYECLPPIMREYIACSAAERFNAQYGSASRKQDLYAETMRARTRAQQFNESNSDTNILRTPDALAVKGNRLTRYTR